MFLVEKGLRGEFDSCLELTADRHHSIFVVRIRRPDCHFVRFLANLHARAADLRIRIKIVLLSCSVYVFTSVIEGLADQAK